MCFLREIFKNKVKKCFTATQITVTVCGQYAHNYYPEVRENLVASLTERITTLLRERAFCVVFEDDLERCWPSKEMTQSEREREIQAFAESHGWTVAIVESAFGTRAIFERLQQG